MNALINITRFAVFHSLFPLSIITVLISCSIFTRSNEKW